jgi:hypothetical protein
MLAEMGIAFDLVAAVVGHEAGGRETRTLVDGQNARGNVTRLEDAKDPAVSSDWQMAPKRSLDMPAMVAIGR